MYIQGGGEEGCVGILDSEDVNKRFQEKEAMMFTFLASFWSFFLSAREGR